MHCGVQKARKPVQTVARRIFVIRPAGGQVCKQCAGTFTKRVQERAAPCGQHSQAPSSCPSTLVWFGETWSCRRARGKAGIDCLRGRFSKKSLRRSCMQRSGYAPLRRATCRGSPQTPKAPKLPIKVQRSLLGALQTSMRARLAALSLLCLLFGDPNAPVETTTRMPRNQILLLA